MKLFWVTVLICWGGFFAFGKDYTCFDIVGDSISAGMNPEFGLSDDHHGWADMLQGAYNDQPTLEDLWPGIEQHNSAVSGSTAAGWAQAGQAPMKTLLDNQPDLVVVYIGGNDVQYGASDGVISEAEMQALEDNLRAIIDILQAATPRPDIIVVTYYDLFDGYSTQTAVSWYHPYSAAAAQGNQVLAQVALDKGCSCVEGVADAFYHHCYGEALGDNEHLTPDYVDTSLAYYDPHPNTAGHRVLHGLVYAKLQELKALQETDACVSWSLYE